MKTVAIVTVMIVCLSCVAFAATREEAAREMVKLTDIRKMSEQVITQVMHMQSEQLKTIAIPKERQADEAALRDRIRATLAETVNWEKLEAEYVRVLADTYTDEELKALLDFCKSPVGQSIVKKEPVIMGKIMLMMQSRVQSVYPDIQKMTRDFAESVKRKK